MSDREPGARQTIDDVLQQDAQRSARRLHRMIARAFSLVWAAARRQLLLAGILQLAAGLSLAGQLLVMRRVLTAISFDEGIPNLTSLLPELVVFALLLVVVSTAAVGQREQQRILAEGVAKHTTGQVLDVATQVELIDFDRSEFYDRLERARVNAIARPLQIAQGVIGMLAAGAAVVAVGITLLLIEPLVAAFILVGGLPGIVINRISARALHRYMISQTPNDRRRMYLFQTLSRKEEAQEIRAFDSQSYLRAEHDRLYDERIRATRRLVRTRLRLGLASGIIASFVAVGSLALLIGLVRLGRLGLSDAAVAVGAVVIVAGRVRALVTSSAALYEGALFLGDFTDFIATRSRADAVPAPPKTALPAFRSVEVRDVSFTYPSRQTPSLEGVSLSIDQGEVIALVGENGSGKTTLTKVLAGLYRPSDGTVYWDGVDQRDLPLDAIRDRVTVIFQDFTRYFLTAHENIAISSHKRMGDRGSVTDAAVRSGALGFLTALPKGLDTLLGPAFSGGSDLSLGQWQRVALARAYFRDAELLILDEPTASLDPRGEYEVFRQVRDLAHGRTIVLVSHRFSNVKLADRIVVLDQGRIVEVGNHPQLLEAGGLYAELYELQARGYREIE